MCKKSNTIVVNRHNTNVFDQYIGRGTIFGNANSTIQNDYVKTKEEAIEAYRYDFYEKIKRKPKFKLAVLMLYGKVIACSCHPAPCHGDVIVEYLDSIKDIDWEKKITIDLIIRCQK